jgi:hypothetical protein
LQLAVYAPQWVAYCSDGRCKVDGKRSVGNLRPSTVSHSFRNSGDLAPNAKRSGANGAVIIGSQAMAAKLEVVVDPAMGGKESLSMRADLNRCICGSRRRVG